MHVLHISSSGNLDGGAEYSLLELLKAFSDFGIVSTVLVPTQGALLKELDKLGVPYIHVKYFQWVISASSSPAKRQLTWLVKRTVNLLAEYKVRRILKRKQFDLVHLNSSAVGVGARSALSLKVPTVWHIREFNSELSGRIFPEPNRQKALISRSERLIAVSNVVSEEYSALITPEKMKIIYDAVARPSFGPRRAEIFSVEPYRIAVVGSIVRPKGQMDVLVALKILRDKYAVTPIVEVLGAPGDPNYLQQLSGFVEEFGLSEQVRFRGSVSNVYEYLMNTDIQVVSSHSESFGRATVEGMLAGCLLIGAANTGTEELLSEGRGLLYSRDANELATVVYKAISRIEEARRIALRGAEFADNISNRRESVQRIVEVFREAAQSN